MNYDTAKLRQFIQAHFGSDDLRTLLFDYFRPYKTMHPSFRAAFGEKSL